MTSSIFGTFGTPTPPMSSNIIIWLTPPTPPLDDVIYGQSISQKISQSKDANYNLLLNLYLLILPITQVFIYFWNTWVQTPILLHSDHHLAPLGLLIWGPGFSMPQPIPPPNKVSLCHPYVSSFHPPPPSPMSSKIIIWLTPPHPLCR